MYLASGRIIDSVYSYNGKTIEVGETRFFMISSDDKQWKRIKPKAVYPEESGSYSKENVVEKQVLFYSNIKTLNSNEHSGLFLRYDTGYGFAAKVNAVPLTTVEFTKAAAEYVIVFAGEQNAITPYAVLGINDNENLFVDEKGNFKTSNIPAFVRRSANWESPHLQM
jgi:hypothetical protein